ncbi:hydrolase [Thaumasiovibrio sp. DFM-14]|uniref:hydrolase n=1 Tax=Thaumasiovibrio sp. DFM-14 TaxID=3384792 RepID=UPI00399F3C4A
MVHSHHFRPAKGIRNPHLQTLLPRFLRREALFVPRTQRLTTPDGDFIDLAWTAETVAPNAPLFVLFHGLEGCFYSPYANGLLHAAAQQGWLGVMMHFRGCSGEPNHYPQSYHSGQTKDARFVLQWLRRHHPQRQVFAVGISLGGNMLINYLAQYQSESAIDAAQVISAPLDLSSCANRIQHGFSQVYQTYLLRSLKRNAAYKAARHPEAFTLSPAAISALPDLWQFDDKVTAPLNGFHSADDYYQQCSGINKLHRITQPLRIIHASDDPFMDEAVIPATTQLPENIEYQLLSHGGHVGFITGSVLRPVFWLEQTVPFWFNAYSV